MSTFNLHIVTPDRDVFSGSVDYMSAETTDGRVGFLRGALPRITLLSAGRIDVNIGAEQASYFCGDGVLYVRKDGIHVITSACRSASEPPADDEPIDIGAAERRQAGDKTYRYARARLSANIAKNKAGKPQDDIY